LAKKSGRAKPAANGANVGYEAELWRMADALRDSPTDVREFVLAAAQRIGLPIAPDRRQGVFRVTVTPEATATLPEPVRLALHVKPEKHSACLRAGRRLTIVFPTSPLFNCRCDVQRERYPQTDRKKTLGAQTDSVS
jgi:hypothetical protein